MIAYIIIVLCVGILIALSGFYKYQEKFIFYPEPIDSSYKFSFKIPCEELFLKSDESEINSLHFKVANSKGVILYFHGNAGSLDSWGLIGEELTQTGYDFFVFDYRGYGKSKGKRHEKGFHEDARMIYDYLLKIYPENKIVLYGRSLGSGFATKLASQTNPKALILETPYFSFERVSKHHFPFLPVSLILQWPIRTDLYLPKVKAPVLIFHGTEDTVTPYVHSIELKKFLKKGDDYVTIQFAGHNDIPTYPEYNLYLKKYLGIQ